jgi:AcrR family transcriptional regulator
MRTARGNVKRRERERRTVRAKILDAARELFVAEGYEATTMRKIAERIEYSPTAIYLHFEDKTALFRELVREDFLALARRFARLAGVRDPVERLRRAGAAYVRFALAHPNHYRLMFLAEPSKLAGAAAPRPQGTADVDAYAFLKAAVAEGIAAGRFRRDVADVERLAQTLWAGLHGVIALYFTRFPDDGVRWLPVREAARVMIDTLLRGLVSGRER